MNISRRTTFSLRTVALLYLTLLLLLPLAVVFGRTFEHGFSVAWNWMTTPAAVSAFWVSVLVAVIAVPLNTIFGVGCALVLVRGKARGRGILDGLIDLPFLVSPVIVGLALILVFGVDGWFGKFFTDHGIRIIYAVPGTGPGDDLRFAAVRGARGRAGADRGGRRAGAGGRDARGLGLADLLAGHAALDPLGRGVRGSF